MKYQCILLFFFEFSTSVYIIIWIILYKLALFSLYYNVVCTCVLIVKLFIKKTIFCDYPYTISHHFGIQCKFADGER